MDKVKKIKKPANLIYGVDDKLTPVTALPVVLQQVIMLSIDLLFPVLIVQSVMGSSSLAQSFVSFTMLAMGAGTMLQSLRKGPIGSGYFCAQETGALYFPASLLAVQKGGFPLLLGMTAAAGFAEIAVAKVIHRFRSLFPAELAGLVVVMLGMSLIPICVSLLSGGETPNDHIDTMALLTGLATLAVIIAVNVWGKGLFKLYSVVVGMISGYLISYLLGVLTDKHLLQLAQAPVLAIPSTDHIGWSFDTSLVAPFLVAMLCSALKTIGNVTTCQKANDDDWKRMDMPSVQGGLMADGLSTLLAGLIGGMGQNSSSGSIGLSIATGVTNRIIGFIVGGVFLLFAFVPKLAALVVIMPKPVMGAILTIVTTFVILTGFQIILSRMLDARKSFMIGLAIIFGLSVDMAPALYNSVPVALKPLFSSSFSLATVVAIGLNLLFRLGVAKSQTIEIQPKHEASKDIFVFLEQAGAAWGARREVITRAIAAVNEFIESASSTELVDGSLKITASFDEYNLDIDICYRGREMAFPSARPSDADLLEDDSAFIHLSGFIIRKYADKIQTGISNGMLHIKLHFEH